MSDLSSTSGQAAQREQFGTNPNVWMPVLWLAVVLALALPSIDGDVFDALSADDAMRLVQVRDLISGQGWFDLFQYRLDPPGASMHWSRVIDVPLAALILLLKPLVGTHGAEVAMLFLWPLLLLAASLVLVAAIARQMSTSANNSQMAAVLLAVLSVPALIHFRPGAIDHHNAQIALLLALVLLTSQIEQSAVKAALGGVVASLSLAIGIEMLPAIAAISLAVFGLFVWRGASVSRQISAFGAGLAASSLLLALALLPLPSLALPVCDTFGGPVLLLAAGGGIGLMTMAAIDRRHSTLRLRVATGTGSAITLVGAFLSLFAGCIASPYAHLDPLVTSLWVDRVVESMSLATMLQLAPQKVLGFYGFPLMTMGFAVAALIRSNPLGRFCWILGVMTLAALIGLSFWEIRGSAAATMLAAPIFAASLTILWPTLASGRTLVILALAVSPASLAALGLSAKPLIDLIFKPQMTIAEQDASTCQTVSDVAFMTQLPNGRVMAPIDLGPKILVATGHAVFAAPYHRNNDGIVAMLKLMLAPIPVAHQILSDRRIDHLVMCSAAPEQDFVKLAPDGLAARLGRGETPDFLERLDVDPTHKISVWRVRR
ncbi:hypothetical protein [Bradyrhizobium sp. LMTR 3]|uniref:hypothetical protein n=1 Tax=Bradyrhizobium sp. LMTR 3 TaxID=189873 RepID=UPI00081080B9|nr:hypothetical protein [Bradyrhizobium sp. LMTR 3]OCK54440.1 hypothetical protein LMTR3_26555 [Bradyrhizobium sp. LMTR 3]